jgi:hypothetical protein
MYRKESRMIEVTDDWYPCHDGNKVQLSILLQEYKLSKSKPPTYNVKVMAWGADDTGMELEYETTFLELATSRYNTWKHYIYNRVPNGIDKEWFYEHGFINA